MPSTPEIVFVAALLLGACSSTSGTSGLADPEPEEPGNSRLAQKPRYSDTGPGQPRWFAGWRLPWDYPSAEGSPSATGRSVFWGVGRLLDPFSE